MTATVAKNKTAAGYFLCRRSEATKLLEKAKTEAAEILKEFKALHRRHRHHGVYQQARHGVQRGGRSDH